MIIIIKIFLSEGLYLHSEKDIVHFGVVYVTKTSTSRY